MYKEISFEVIHTVRILEIWPIVISVSHRMEIEDPITRAKSSAPRGVVRNMIQWVSKCNKIKFIIYKDIISLTQQNIQKKYNIIYNNPLRGFIF